MPSKKDDINNLKKENRELREKIKKLQKNKILTEISNSLNHAIFKMSVPDGVYLYLSDSTEKVIGYPKEVFLNNPFFIEQIIHPEFKEFL